MSREIQQKPKEIQNTFTPPVGGEGPRPVRFCQPLKLKTAARLIDKSDNVQKTERSQAWAVFVLVIWIPQILRLSFL